MNLELNKCFKTVIVHCALLAGMGIYCSAAVFEFGTQKITVPDGFVVEKIAGNPLTDRPITSDFDEQGRLYISESSGTNDNVETQLAEKPHSILRLEDTDGDGVFDSKTVFADKMMFPEGTLWHDGSLYVTAPPEIWKLTDTDDDGVADQREVWYNPGTLTGCANDLHGPFLGLDGWIYWCKGAFAEQTHTLTTGDTFVSRASHIFRRHPDGGGVEPVMTGGMDNPVELAFMPGGERIFSSTFFQHPGGGQRDGLVHDIYGGTYGKIHNVIDDHPRTGEVLPVLTHLGPAAACALMRYESGTFGPDYRDNLFSSSFNLSKITRHKLVQEGSTYRSVDTDFMVSDSADFHPTHIEEDADGSLIVIDTGGWYKLCCPTSQLHKPDVFGGIYRIRKANAASVIDPRGLALDWSQVSESELANRLADERFMVRKRAVEAMTKKGVSAISELESLLNESSSPIAREASIWALTRIDHENARVAVISALDDENDTVRQAALNSIALWRDHHALSSITEIVINGTAHNRRAAAEALGRIGDSTAANALLFSAETAANRILEHSIIYALIEIDNPEAVRPALTSSKNPRVLRTALIAMDQMPSSDLKAQEIIPFLQSKDPLLIETAEWITNRHKDWGTQLAAYLESSFQSKNFNEEQSERLITILSNSLNEKSIQSLVANSLIHANESVRKLSMEAIRKSQMNTFPESWISSFETLLESDQAQQSDALKTLESLPLKSEKSEWLRAKVNQIAHNSADNPELRLLALNAISNLKQTINESDFEYLTDCLAPDQTIQTRSSASSILGKANLSQDQLLDLAEVTKEIGPLELRALLPAFENQSDEALGLKLIASLQAAKAIQSLSVESLTPILTSFPDSVQGKAQQLFESIFKDKKEQADHVESVLASLPQGDIRRGQAIFNSPLTACSSCHAIGYLGGTLGPDLTTVGTVRTERDLLEAVLYPSASFVRSYETFQVTTHDGITHLGILKEESSEGVELLLASNLPIRISRENIADMTPGNLSLMPSGLTAALSEQQLADLITFLKNTKWR